MRIVGFSKTSLLDWDGCVASTVYLPGCNFRCPACHNRDLVLEPERLDDIPLSDMEDFIRSNREFLDGVVVTGGEPTIHDDLPELVRLLRGMGMRVKLDTNGCRPEMLEALLDEGLLDFVAMDIKAPLNEKYTEVTGTEVKLERIKRSISIITNSGVDYEFRTTVVPIFLDKKDIESIAAYIGGARKYA
ncbi:MAG: anaerobic ribonucleoside-triphosphate reductase activating protein, partial [Euryarchaeota archaeon]|nr:anaerobic ribonucleoside-triphosphate reductase activating protein [Euryarchaeota archaeon]